MSDSKSSSLRPTAPSFSKRYNRCSQVQPLPSTIPPAFFTPTVDPEPQYLPPGWTSQIHPEGQLYFYCDGPLKVVTEGYLHDPEVPERISHWTSEVLKSIDGLGIALTGSIELYLELDDDDKYSCLYYLINHSTQSIFWLESMPTTLLDISPIVSTSHLKLALEELYWNHVEYFPTHPRTSTVRAVDTLISVFTHAQADCMTSEYSTFPYTSEQSARFLKLLRPYQGKEPDSHILCFVARLWGIVASHRFSTHYGEQHCRLSRDQTILFDTPAEKHWSSSVLSRLLFGLPAECVDKFESLWVDNVVYTEQWRSFMTFCQEERKLFISWAFASMILNSITLALGLGSKTLALCSIFSAYASMIVGLVLYIRQQGLTNATASDAAIYLQAVKHENHGFQFVSLLYSLPKALFFWSLVLYVPQGSIMAFRLFGVVPLAVAGGVFSSLALVLYLVMSPPSVSWAVSRSTKDVDEVKWPLAAIV